MLEMDIERHHQHCGCGRFIEVGSRFRRMVMNWETGEREPWSCTVVEVSRLTATRMFCRRVTLVGDDGRICKPFVQSLFEQYQHIDNVVSFPR